jgi:membrane-associated phospholipid phosphatase
VRSATAESTAPSAGRGTWTDPRAAAARAIPARASARATRRRSRTSAAALAVALNQPVGHLFAEARPYAVHPGLLRLADPTRDSSFPSDHAVMAGSVAAGLLLVSRRLGMVAVAAAVLMAFARVYIAAHYPWDVLAGLALGAAVAVVGWVLLRRPLISLVGWLRSLPGVRAWFGEEPLHRQHDVAPVGGGR